MKWVYWGHFHEKESELLVPDYLETRGSCIWFQSYRPLMYIIHFFVMNFTIIIVKLHLSPPQKLAQKFLLPNFLSRWFLKDGKSENSIGSKIKAMFKFGASVA